MIEKERVIENETSSSNIVIRATVHGFEVTLDPMETPVTKVDIYAEEAEAFVEAIEDLSRLVGGICRMCETNPADYHIQYDQDDWGIYCEPCATDPAGPLQAPDADEFDDVTEMTEEVPDV